MSRSVSDASKLYCHRPTSAHASESRPSIPTRKSELFAARGVSFDEAWARQVSSVAAKRFGTPTEFGKTCAFVCSDHAGYMSGTNLHLEGGTYTGIV